MSRCDRCDRADCPWLPFETMDHEAFDDATATEDDYAAMLRAQVNCDNHLVDWRERALEAEARATAATERAERAEAVEDLNTSMCNLLARVVREREAWGGASGVFTAEERLRLKAFADAHLVSPTPAPERGTGESKP